VSFPLGKVVGVLNLKCRKVFELFMTYSGISK